MIELRLKTNWKWYEFLGLLIGIFLLIKGEWSLLFDWLTNRF